MGRVTGKEGDLARVTHHHRQHLKVQVSDPIDQVEEQEGRGEKDPGIGVQLQDIYVDTPFSPGPRLALFIAAEEALTVFAVQTLIDTGLFEFLPVHGIAQSDHRGWWRPHVKERIVLQATGMTQKS